MFRFKQFTIIDDGATMKVGTDAVLLATLATPLSEPCRILDIGTGCGVIALIMAQRFRTAVVDAIDIDKDSCIVATNNFNNSPWGNRLYCQHTPLQTFQSLQPYDLIVCNPPYFSHSLHNNDNRKSLARHDDNLNLETLFIYSQRLLSPDGTLWIVQPVPNRVFSATENTGLYLTNSISITNKPHSTARLCLYGFSHLQKDPVSSSLSLRNSDNHYSDTYKKVTADFYLWENKSL